MSSEGRLRYAWVMAESLFSVRKEFCYMQVRSPLRECGLAKDNIRRRSREAGLFTRNKPGDVCLAARISTGETIAAKN